MGKTKNNYNFQYKVLRKQFNSSMCFVCGMTNQLGAQAFFYECEKINGEHKSAKVLLTMWQPKEEHQSYPNRLHGGVASAMLDEAIGRTFGLIDPDAWGVTLTLTTRYHKPTPLNQPLYIESRITSTTSRGFEGEGKLFTADGTICATAQGKYLICPIEQIAGDKLSDDKWFYVPEKLPKFIKI